MRRGGDFQFFSRAYGLKPNPAFRGDAEYAAPIGDANLLTARVRRSDRALFELTAQTNGPLKPGHAMSWAPVRARGPLLHLLKSCAEGVFFLDLGHGSDLGYHDLNAGWRRAFLLTHTRDRN
jgi:hypothetical protein